jgi:acetyl-CoA acetyltransferase
MIKDGLWDAFNGLSHGHHGRERRAPVADHPRGSGQVRVASQNKAEAAKKAGKFKDEMSPVTIKGKKGDVVVAEDEYIRDGATLESVAKLRPAFDKAGTGHRRQRLGHQRRCRRCRRADDRSRSQEARLSSRSPASCRGARGR